MAFSGPPRLLLRTAALNALATAAANTGDPDFAPIASAQIFLGQTWPSQSPEAGSGPLPAQLLLYAWEENSESLSGNMTAPKFKTTLSLVVEARTEVNAAAAQAVLPAQPSQLQIDAAIDGVLDLLCFAVKKAICQGIRVAVQSLFGKPVIEAIRSVKTTYKLSPDGQRIAGNGGVLFDLEFGEFFEPILPNALTELTILLNPEAGGVANSGNVGNGTISSVAIGLGAVPGSYAVAFTSATAFTVTPPSGGIGGSGVVGTPYSAGGLTFTITAGRTAFSTGDGFTVFVQVITQTILDLNA
jgi:hypothetical protein